MPMYILPCTELLRCVPIAMMGITRTYSKRDIYNNSMHIYSTFGDGCMHVNLLRPSTCQASCHTTEHPPLRSLPHKQEPCPTIVKKDVLVSQLAIILNKLRQAKKLQHAP